MLICPGRQVDSPGTPRPRFTHLFQEMFLVIISWRSSRCRAPDLGIVRESCASRQSSTLQNELETTPVPPGDFIRHLARRSRTDPLRFDPRIVPPDQDIPQRDHVQVSRLKQIRRRICATTGRPVNASMRGTSRSCTSPEMSTNNR